MRSYAGLLALFLLLIGVPACHANQDGLAGNWKVSFLDGPDLITFWLAKLEVKDGKITGTIDAAPKVPPATLKDVVQKGDKLTLNLDLADQPLQLVFAAPKGASKRLVGTMTFRNESYPAQLESTKDESAKDFEPFTAVKIPKGDFKELKDEVGKRLDDIGVFIMARIMLDTAVKDKVPANELKAALAPVLKVAQGYGEWHREMLVQFARQTAIREGYAGLGEEFARQALKEFGDSADPSIQLRCLDLIALSLMKQDKKVEVAKLRGRIGELEIKGHEENEKAGLGFAPGKIEHRKNGRPVLVELFTGAACPPCVAADLAFEGLGKTYDPSQVVLLQYHLHIPAPDPLTTPETEARAKYYGDEVGGTPSIFFNGKSAAGGGGPRPGAAAKYKEYRGVIDPALDNDNKIALAVDAKRDKDIIAITANASGYKPSDKLKLRLALVEPWVRYAGSNGLSYHAHVVRALPGGPGGIPLAKDAAKEAMKVDLAEVRQAASKHLDEFAFLDGQRPFSYRNLMVVAFIQNDETKEVLHAVEAVVK
jgi:thiol-disulfide isomerase/thioredoxin